MASAAVSTSTIATTIRPRCLSLATYGARSTGGGVALRSADHRGRYRQFRAGLRQYDRSRSTRPAPSAIQDFVREFGDYELGRCWAPSAGRKDTVDSRIYPTKGHIPPAERRIVPCRAARCAITRPPTSTSATSRLRAQYTLDAEWRARLCQWPQRQVRCRSSRTSTPAASAPCVATRATPSDRSTPTTSERLGGNRRMVGNAEFLFPMPGMGQDKSMRLGAFFDAGQVWGDGERPALRRLALQLRYFRRVEFAGGTAEVQLRPANQQEDRRQTATLTVPDGHGILIRYLLE